MPNNVLNIPYVIDLGNGFIKKTNGVSTDVEPSVLAETPDFFSTTSNPEYTKLSFIDDVPFYVGNDVIKSGLTPAAALGDDDINRYDSPEFKKLLFGSIAKDFKDSIVIPHLVTGLPVNHFKAKAADVSKMIEGKKVVKVNGEEIIIEVNKAHVIPQPMGTYMYLVNSKQVNPEEDLTLIVDGGHGSLDVTEMKGYTITRRAGSEIGVKNAYIDIYNVLVDMFGDMRSISIQNIHNLLKNGLMNDSNIINISDIPEVKRILNNHFNSTFNFIRDNRFDLKSYHNVIFTGGMALLHKERILEKRRQNFTVLEEGQTANVQGYFDYGKAVLENEKASTLR